ncbi:MAG: hypothetical protein IKO29_03195 [Bacteroidales bacterium]|nr:hypothetical protein [Bacteroidales bacterium]
MKKLISIVVVLIWTLAAFAQESRIPQRLELVEIETDEGDTQLEVFNMPEDGQNHYYLSVGRLGIGDEIIQVQFDPLFELFIPLGDKLADSMDVLSLLQELFKQSPGASLEVPGCLAVGFPKDESEPVKVTFRKLLLTRMLEFSVERDGYLRATHVSRSDFNSLVNSLKFYRRIHPNEL